MARTEQRSCMDTCRHEYTDTLCRLSEVLLAFASGVLTMMTFGTPYWLVRGSAVDDVEQIHYHMGLWQNCTVQQSCQTLSLHRTSVPTFLLFSRVFISLALASGLMAWAVCLLALLQRKARWMFVSAIVYVLQAIFLLLGLSTFSRAYRAHKDTHAGWSYTLGWVAFLFCLICAAYFILTAVYRLHSPDPSKSHRGSVAQNSSYTPLAQFEETSGSSSEDDAKL